MHVSDHSLVRYIDRRLRIGVDKLSLTQGVTNDRDILAYLETNCRIDVEAWREELKELAERASAGEPDERGYVWLDRLGFFISRGTLVTVIPEDRSSRLKRSRRLPKIRRPAFIARQHAKAGRVKRRRALEESL